ncbi:SnoaL-like domain protein [Anatilimnocola aggregata]|uniref:SnoaL-like domain protein n=1 Tax=Anatilimnocola aggregata TaxID=2528021 RepID=A0A517Y9P5_9BACT|nr:SgcJ/EcaC family oxidoreductase [Anatilimnocola aggregata]QDU26882.1 SnoaL-like domain protein [Anatilimnocola aggregata]
MRPAVTLPVIAVLIWTFLSTLSSAQKPTVATDQKPTVDAAAELAAIRAESSTFVTAFNKRDAKAVAALFTEDGQYIDDAGRKFSGRAAIEKEYAEHFAQNPTAKITILIDSLRLLSDGAAMEEGRATVDPAPEGAPGVSKYSAVHVKVGGKWQMATVRDTWEASPSTHDKVADLNWLIGNWSAEEHGGKMESTCRWIANKSFVERRYTTTHADGTMTSGLQIIGWNPAERSVQSWNFSNDGGHAIGFWSPVENGWSAEVRGVTGTGAPTTAVNHLKRLDENAYVWQSTNRTVAGQSVADTDEVVLKRQAAKK